MCDLPDSPEKMGFLAKERGLGEGRGRVVGILDGHPPFHRLNLE